MGQIDKLGKLGLRCWSLGLVCAVGMAMTGRADANWVRDDAGWTVFEPSADTRIVYVSSSEGDDAHSGLTPDDPVRSISAGAALLRDGHPDWLLLQRGDTWTNESFGSWSKQGRSAAEPMLIGAYGEGARPLVRTGDAHAFAAWRPAADTMSHLALTGLHLQASHDGAEGPTGILWHRPGENLLIEDMRIEGYKDNVVVMSVDSARPFRNLEIRRSVIHDAFARHTDLEGGSHAQGVYVANTVGILIEQNVLDHNGWNPEMEGAVPTIFNHNLYIQSTTDDLVVRGNVIARASSHGLQARHGGVVERNLFVGNSLGFYISAKPGVARENVLLHASRKELHPDGGARGWGIEMMDIEGSELLHNLLAHTPDGRLPLSRLDGVTQEGNVVYQWGEFTDEGDFPDPDRTLASYDALIGGAGSVESFLSEARELSRENWPGPYTADAVIDYFHEGFDIPEPAAVGLLAFAGLMLRRGRR